MNHEHGPHECVCVNCGYTSIVDAYIKCNTLACPGCGEQMRASQTGEYRGTQYGRSQVTAIANNAPPMGAVLAIALIVVGIGFAVIAKKVPPKI